MTINEKISIWGTKAFSSMWTFWAFFVWGLLGMMPGLPAHITAFILMVSSAFIQLWALPLLAVGNALLSKKTESRAEKDHKMIMAELTEVRNMHHDIKKLLEKIDKKS